jgi:type 1 glutamine amidotransferase
MINILVLCDDYWHPSEVIKRGFGSIKTGEFSFDFVEDAKDILSLEMINSYQAIACCKQDCINSANRSPWFDEGITEVGIEELKNYVATGHGYLSLHSSNTAKEGMEYGKFIGNYFLGHPPRCSINIKILGDHPIVKGISDFVIRDEHYKLDYFAKDAVEIFKTESEAGGIQTGGYAMEYGKGRICIMTPGHILPVWEHPSYQKLLINAFKWCTGTD